VPEAYIVSAVRTAGGRRGGRLAGVHPVDLAALSLDAIADRSGIDPAAIDDVIMGCVTQAGEQSLHIGRNAVLASKLPQSVPAVSIDRQCGSSQQAIQFAAQAVMSGTQDVVIAAGVESMSRVPMGLSVNADKGMNPFPASVTGKYGVPMFSQFMGAEMIAAKYGHDRARLDAYALASHQRAKAATEAGAFADEIVAVEVTLPDGTTVLHEVDEGIRFDARESARSSC
jgi:acetyl-CoA C-acetyltransferase